VNRINKEARKRDEKYLKARQAAQVMIFNLQPFQ